MLKPGLVGVIAQDAARFSSFAASLTALTVPPGCAIKWIMGHKIASAFNELVRSFLEAEDLEWLFLLGDDHTFDSDVLLRLLEHDRDIVVPLCLTRAPPYGPVIFSSFTDGGDRWRVNLDDYPDGGLLPIHSAGTAGMVIRREVLEAVGEPWFEIGKTSQVDIDEDVWFCDKAREAGFDLFCDLDTTIGHTTVATVYPVRTEDGWTFEWSFPGGFDVSMPVGSWKLLNVS